MSRDRIDFVKAMNAQHEAGRRAVEARCTPAQIATLYGVFQEMTAYRRVEDRLFLDKIARWTGTSVKQVGRHLKSLHDKGVIDYHAGRGKGVPGRIVISRADAHLMERRGETHLTASKGALSGPISRGGAPKRCASGVNNPESLYQRDSPKGGDAAAPPDGAPSLPPHDVIAEFLNDLGWTGTWAELEARYPDDTRTMVEGWRLREEVPA